MKIYVNRKPVSGPWGGGNMYVSAMYNALQSDSSNHEICDPTNPMEVPDSILLAGLTNEGGMITPDRAIMYKMMHRPDVKLILRVNENDARKGTSGVDENLIKISEYIDGTVFVSDWLKNYFLDQGWKCKNNTVIHNGVDGEIFKPAEKIDNGKINIVTHHWSNNYMKGFDYYDLIDEFVSSNKDKFTFTYIGRERGTFSKNTKIVRPLAGEALGEELGKYDVYISASRFDPGPNHILESLSCGLPTYVFEEGGGCCEFAGEDHVFNNFAELKTILESGNFSQNTQFIAPSWETCVEKYVKYIEEVCRD